MTDAQRNVLARLSDGEWRLGHQLDCSPIVLGALNNRGMIRGADDGRFGFRTENWTITTKGIEALQVAG